MGRSKRSRWRDSRDTMPARRRRRRTHRRDQKRGSTYYPMVVDSKSALRGVRTRLMGAVAATLVTLSCVIFAIASAMSSFGSTFALTVGLCSFGAAVALLLSARQEEEVHAFAAQLGSGQRSSGQLPGQPTISLAGEPHHQSLIEDRAIEGRRALPEPLPVSEVSEISRHSRLIAPRVKNARPGLSGVRRHVELDKTDGAI